MAVRRGWLRTVIGSKPAYPRYNRGAGEGLRPFEPRQRPSRGCCAPLRTLGQGRTRALPRPSRCDARPTSTSTPGDTLPSPSDSPMRGYSPALNTVDKWWGVPHLGIPRLAPGRMEPDNPILPDATGSLPVTSPSRKVSSAASRRADHVLADRRPAVLLSGVTAALTTAPTSCPERKHMMQIWADYLDRLRAGEVEPGTVRAQGRPTSQQRDGKARWAVAVSRLGRRSASGSPLTSWSRHTANGSSGPGSRPLPFRHPHWNCRATQSAPPRPRRFRRRPLYRSLPGCSSRTTIGSQPTDQRR